MIKGILSVYLLFVGCYIVSKIVQFILFLINPGIPETTSQIIGGFVFLIIALSFVFVKDKKTSKKEKELKKLHKKQ